jgi:hypothetical protein
MKNLICFNDFAINESELVTEKKDQTEVTSKDTMRVDDIIVKAGGRWNEKAEQLTKQMAKSIDDGYKALRRGLAAQEENYHAMAKIFFLRAGQLGITE